MVFFDPSVMFFLPLVQEPSWYFPRPPVIDFSLFLFCLVVYCVQEWMFHLDFNLCGMAFSLLSSVTTDSLLFLPCSIHDFWMGHPRGQGTHYSRDPGVQSHRTSYGFRHWLDGNMGNQILFASLIQFFMWIFDFFTYFLCSKILIGLLGNNHIWFFHLSYSFGLWVGVKCISLV